MNNFIEFTKEEIEKPITERFEKIVSFYGQQAALKTGTKTITYDVLNKAANRLARTIVAVRGEIFKHPIILLFDSGELFVSSILGVFKTGNMYVALMPSLPEKRLFQIVKDSEAKLIITNSTNLSLAQKLAQNNLNIINIDSIQCDTADHNLSLELPENLPAAIFFTSGSTGKPKGVLQNQNLILHKIWLFTNQYKVGTNDRKCFLLQFNFAPSLPSLFSFLLNGGTVCLYDVKKQGLEPLTRWLIQEEINHFHCATPIFRNWLDTLTKPVFFPKLRLVSLGGDKLYKTDVERFWQYVPSECQLLHGYGSSESGVISQISLDRHSVIPDNIVSAGYSIEDKEILLLDDTGKQVEVNQVGEIAVKSPYLSSGYWRNPQLTQEKFLPAPDGGKSRIYLTGDLGFWNSDGSIEVLGRKDFMVKIRGFRVELGEIEANLREHPHIKQTVVTTKGDNPEDKKLIAYFIPTNQKNIHPRQLRDFLGDKLPDYMIPSAFVSLESFPLTPNGKIDIKALPEPNLQANIDTEFIAPRNKTETKLAQIWQQVLAIDKIGIKDNFFALGGHSLIAIQMLYQIQKEFAVELSLRYLFEHSTIEQLSHCIDVLLWTISPTDESKQILREEGEI